MRRAGYQHAPREACPENTAAAVVSELEEDARFRNETRQSQSSRQASPCYVAIARVFLSFFFAPRSVTRACRKALLARYSTRPHTRANTRSHAHALPQPLSRSNAQLRLLLLLLLLSPPARRVSTGCRCWR